MSFKGRIEAECPSCSETEEVEVWTFVRADMDGRLRDALLAGDLNLLCCPDCGALYYPESTVVYSDPQAELLAFIFPPSYEAEAERWRKKMREDHAAMQAALKGKTEPLLGEPLICFGLEPFRELLQSDDDLEDEARVAEYLCKDLGLAVAAVDRAFAREKRLPYLLPAGKTGAPRTQAGVLGALDAVVKANDRLEGFARWRDQVRAEGLPPFKR